MNQGKRISENGYGHNDHEWGLVDDSENLEWEQYENSRKRAKKRRDEECQDLPLNLMSKMDDIV